jgi:hypothetical protein
LSSSALNETRFRSSDFGSISSLIPNGRRPTHYLMTTRFTIEKQKAFSKYRSGQRIMTHNPLRPSIQSTSAGKRDRSGAWAQVDILCARPKCRQSVRGQCAQPRLSVIALLSMRTGSILSGRERQDTRLRIVARGTQEQRTVCAIHKALSDCRLRTDAKGLEGSLLIRELPTLAGMAPPSHSAHFQQHHLHVRRNEFLRDGRLQRMRDHRMRLPL